MSHINIEIKAKCAKPQQIRDLLFARGAEFRGVDPQIDTYFKTSQGRLKLREGSIENSLIFYDREDREGPKQANVSLVSLSPNSGLKEILTRILGVLVVVKKQREIYFIENVKFHIDVVEELGSFMEIEAIDADDAIGKEMLLAQCQEFLRLFAVAPEDLVAVSYSDLLLARTKTRSGG